ncbi:hypothetical protein [Amycolatopsis anabasis]|uniref:hypothetical protein n=1 Tax=Amycolatopsis anabasis TaxID=1840409 RepID=UPI00131AD736|nr:hypothetical protein [Amycolatopsis anabasis]
MGAIELSVDGVDIIGKAEADDVETLWAYLANMVEEFRANRNSSTLFPDQPIELSFKGIERGRVLVASTVNGERRAAPVDENELFAALTRAGGEFFDKMETMVQRFYQLERSKLSPR